VGSKGKLDCDKEHWGLRTARSRLTRVFFAKLPILRVKTASGRCLSRPAIAPARASTILPQRAVFMEVITPHKVSKRRAALNPLVPFAVALFLRVVCNAVSAAVFAGPLFAADHALKTSFASRTYLSIASTSMCVKGILPSAAAASSSPPSMSASSSASKAAAGWAPAGNHCQKRRKVCAVHRGGGGGTL